MLKVVYGKAKEVGAPAGAGREKKLRRSQGDGRVEGGKELRRLRWSFPPSCAPAGAHIPPPRGTPATGTPTARYAHRGEPLPREPPRLAALTAGNPCPRRTTPPCADRADVVQWTQCGERRTDEVCLLCPRAWRDLPAASRSSLPYKIQRIPHDSTRQSRGSCVSFTGIPPISLAAEVFGEASRYVSPGDFPAKRNLSPKGIYNYDV